MSNPYVKVGFKTFGGGGYASLTLTLTFECIHCGEQLQEDRWVLLHPKFRNKRLLRIFDKAGPVKADRLSLRWNGA